MPDLDNSGSNPQSATKRKARQRRKNRLGDRAESSPPESDQEPMPKLNGAVSSSLESIHIPPRTPKNALGSGEHANSMEEIELSLLTSEERRRASAGLSLDDAYVSKGKAGMSSKDKRGMILLIVLCECSLFRDMCLAHDACKDLIQGVPVCWVLVVNAKCNNCTDCELPAWPCLRFSSILAPRTSFIRPSRNLRASWIPLLSKTSLVTYRRFVFI